LSEKIASGVINYSIHIGDQIYLDDARWEGDTDSTICKCQELWLNSYKKVFLQQLSELNIENEKNEAIPKNITIWEEERITLANTFLKIISEDYRENYNYFYQAKAMRTCPNIMILDDHDIYDNFGFHNIDYINRNNFDYFFSEHARICYYRYQKQLW